MTVTWTKPRLRTLISFKGHLKFFEMFTQLNSIQIQSLIKIYSDAEKKGY